MGNSMSFLMSNIRSAMLGLPGSDFKLKSMSERNASQNQSNLQKLYDYIFHNIPEEKSFGLESFTHSDFHQRVRSMLAAVTLADLGIKEDWVRHEVKNLLYISVVKEERFHIAVLVLPAKGLIPLHNHPGMAVFSSVLYGDLDVESFDPEPSDILLENSSQLNNNGFKHNHHLISNWKFSRETNQALLSAKRAMCENKNEKSGAWSLSPSSGNIHSFSSTQPAVVIDVIMPPYNPQKGRDCIYFKLLKKENKENKHSLLAFMPDWDKLPQTFEYFGPQVAKTKHI